MCSSQMGKSFCFDLSSGVAVRRLSTCRVFAKYFGDHKWFARPDRFVNRFGNNIGHGVANL